MDVVLPDADGYELYKIQQDLDHKNAVIIFSYIQVSDEDVVKAFHKVRVWIISRSLL